jgi:ATP-dependent Clp protease protease subunit
MKEELNKILSKHSGQPLARIEKDSDRDFFMSAQESQEYGLVDQVISGISAIKK